MSLKVDQIIALCFLIIVLLTAAISDVLSKRIPNWLTYPAMILATVYHTTARGLEGFLFSIEGVAVGIAVLIVIYLLGGTGAGDVKLMGAIGALLGPKDVFIAFVFTSFVGGIYALVLLIIHGYLSETVKRYWATLKSFVLTRNFIYVPPSEREKKPKLRYGVAIALGTLISILGGIEM